MPRFARIVIPGVPHHVVQRGNRRQKTFFRPSDYNYYLDMLEAWGKEYGLIIWAYCLMPNHVHLIVEPKDELSLARGVGDVNRRYTRMVNFRKKWRGYLWQGRFGSFPMDTGHLLRCARYILLNPVRAKLVRKPWRWKWSSIHAHMKGEDSLVSVGKLGQYVDDWKEFLEEGMSEEDVDKLRLHSGTGRPLGGNRFLNGVEKLLGRSVRPGKPGRPR
jgi:putative transposase